MKPRVLIGLLVAALLVIVLALSMEASRKPASELSATGPALPGLLERMETVEEVRITRAGGERVATLQRRDDGWQLVEKAYPADADSLRKLLLDLARAKRVEAKTSNPDLYAKLGVEDVTAKDAQGVQLELLGGGDPLQLIVGSNYGQGTGTYVRVPGEAQSWLIAANIAVETKTQNWLEKDLIDVQPNRIAAVDVSAGKDQVLIGRNEDGDFRVTNVPKGREPSSDFFADATVGLLQGLRIEDVAAKPAEPVVERQAKFELNDGLSIEMSSWQQDNQTWVALSAALDEDKAKQHIAAEQAKEVSDWEAEQAAQSPSAESAEGPDAATANGAGEADAAAEADQTASAANTDESTEAPPLAVSDAEADAQARLKSLQDQVASWNAAFDGRQFQLPSFKAGNLNRGLEDYLKPKE